MSRPISEMSVWKRSRARYARSGPELWHRGVIPFEVSSNPALAATYAHVIAAWLRDARAKQIRPCVLEIGCGTGRFGYYMLRALEGIDCTYVMSDISEKALQAVREHRRLREYVRSGRLQVTPWAFGDALPRGFSHTIVVANYVFDSVPVDMFSARTGALCEWRAQGERFVLEPVRGRRYRDALMEETLRHFAAERYPIVSVSPPLVAFLRSLEAPSLLLVSDKAFVRKDQPTRELSPFIQNHGGTASATVDLEALARIARGLGMRALVPNEVASFSTAAFSLGPRSITATEASFAQAFGGGGVIESLRIWARLSAARSGIDVQDAIALLRQSRGDPEIFARLAPKLEELLRPEHRGALLDGLRLVAKNLFFTGDPQLDPSFALGELFMRLSAPEDAERCFRDAVLNGTKQRQALEALSKCYRALGREADANEAEAVLRAAMHGSEAQEDHEPWVSAKRPQRGTVGSKTAKAR